MCWRSHQPSRGSDLSSVPSPSSTLHLPADTSQRRGEWSLELYLLPPPPLRSQETCRVKRKHKSGIERNPDSIASSKSTFLVGRGWLEIGKRHHQPHGAENGHDTKLKRPICRTNVLKSKPAAGDGSQEMSFLLTSTLEWNHLHSCPDQQSIHCCSIFFSPALFILIALFFTLFLPASREFKMWVRQKYTLWIPLPI